MLRKVTLVLTIAILAVGSSTASAATTKQLVKCNGWRGLLCCNDVPDCICKYGCPDYCKKPLPCPCGPLPPNLSFGSGPKRWWSFGCGCQRSCEGKTSGYKCGQ